MISHSRRNPALFILVLVAMVLGVLAVGIGSAGAAETQRTILDINGWHDHTDYFPTNTQQSDRNIIDQPGNYKSPVNYHQGTWYARVAVQSKPSSKPLYTQLCMWQHTPTKRDFKYETCSPRQKIVIVDEGVYYAAIDSPSSWWNKSGGPFDWSKPADMVRFFLKDPVSEKLMYTERCGSACYPFNDINQHMPIQMDVEIIMVAKGAQLSQPSNWNCPSSICGSSGGGGGTTTTQPQSTTTTKPPTNTTTTVPTGGVSAKGKTILLTNKGGVANGDTGMRNALVAAGRSVLVLADTAITSTQAGEADLIVISSSVTPSEVPDWLKTVATPIMVNEAYVFDDLGLAGQPGEAVATAAIDVAAGHPIAGSFSGSTTVMSPADRPNVGSPASAADVIATADGKATIFAYDTGETMNSGTAPARRVGFFMSYGAGVDATANAYTLFDNAVAWLTGSGGGTSTTTTTTTTTTSTTLPPSATGGVLLVTNRGKTSGGDANIADAIRAAGYSLTVVEETKLTSAQLNGADMAVISSSIVPRELPSFVKNSATPLVVLEAYVFDDLGMASSPRDRGPIDSINVVDSSHAIAGGLSGSTVVLTPADTLASGTPGSGADVVATYPGSPDIGTIFAYNAGDQMKSGTAAGKRVGFFLSWGASSDANSTAYQLFTRALAWAAS